MHCWSGQLTVMLLDREKGTLSKTLVSCIEAQQCWVAHILQHWDSAAVPLLCPYSLRFSFMNV